MKVCLVSYENLTSWILGSLTTNLARELRGLGIDTEIADRANPTADINHHIIYIGYDGSRSSIDTLMITHIDTAAKVTQLQRQLQVAQSGVCLSSDTMNKLVALGLPRERLCYANFPSPQQGLIERRQTSIGITSRCYPSGCKREYLLGELAPFLPPGEFVFHIMGLGWDCVMDELRRNGSDVVFHGDFDAERYRRLWRNLDYYLYLGQDEGSTGFLDALEAGVPTIATPQGFHLDLYGGLVHPIDDLDDLVTIFGKLATDRQSLRAAVAQVDWTQYALKHVALWSELINQRAGKVIHPVDRLRLEAMGISVDSPDCSRGRLAAMPAESGPGGAVHRPRLLVIADENLEEVEEAWHKIVRSGGDIATIVLRREGEPPEPDVVCERLRLEVKIVDWRSRDTSELVTMSLEYDAVAFWNMISPEVLDLFSKRRKPNYLFRSSALSNLNDKLSGGRPLEVTWPRTILFDFVPMLSTFSRAKTISFLTRPLKTDAHFRSRDEAKLRACLSRVDAVIYTDDALTPLVSSCAGRFRRVPSLDNSTELDGWAPAIDSIFETIEATRNAEEPGWLLRIARAATRVVNLRGSRRR